MTMFAQLTTMRCLPDQLEELAGLYEQHVLPVTQAQMGYRGLYLLLDRASGKVVALSLWDSSEDAAACQGSAQHRDQLSQLAGYLAATPDGEGYEVSVDA
jgi:heme-degrading monooxygenase HmoA